MVQGRNTHWNMTGSKLLRPTIFFQDHEFGHKVSHVYIVMFYHFERFQLWIFKGCVFFFRWENGPLPIASHSHLSGFFKWWIPKSPWLQLYYVGMSGNVVYP